MKFSEAWLRTFVDPELSTQELADALTMAGLEVEALEAVAPPFERVVVGLVLSVEKHPAADRLNLTRVDVGCGEPLAIVCGAPNVKAGLRVPCALVGAKLQGIEIKQAKVRGVESHGMLCSAKELGLAEDASGLLVLAADAPVGTDVREYLRLDDQIFTLKLTPNRSDCLSVFGIAREVAAITGASLHALPTKPAPVSIQERREVTLDAPAACPRYCGRIVRGVNPKAPTPAWIVERLERSGLRAISAIVDVTNYVMLELGQPLHAFDLARLDGAIHARFARPGETLTLLNGETRALEPQFLVIADDRKPVALAGIMGGAESAVGDDTAEIFVESAFFEPAVIAGKSRVLGFGSDSAYRFERGVDYGATREALERATALVLEICGGSAGPMVDASARLPARNPVRLRAERAQQVLGVGLGTDRIADILRRLHFEFKVADSAFTVFPPSYRFDIAIEEDLIEEIARIHGYENVPERAPAGAAIILPQAELRRDAYSLRRLLAMRDYQEIVSFSFVDEQWERDFCGNDDPVRLANPIASQMNVMRSSLIGSLVQCLRHNLSHKQQRVRVFEMGRCFRRGAGGYEQTMMLGGLAFGSALPEQWGTPTRQVDFYDVKSDIEAMCSPAALTFEPASHPSFHPGKAARISLNGRFAGWVGAIHPQWRQKYDLQDETIGFELNLDVISALEQPVYREVSKFPQVRRDIAVIVDECIPAVALVGVLRQRAPQTVAEVTLFDVYRGKGIDSDKKSLAFSVLMQDTRKTLTDAEVDIVIDQLVKVLQEEFDARLRS